MEKASRNAIDFPKQSPNKKQAWFAWMAELCLNKWMRVGCCFQIAVVVNTSDKSKYNSYQYLMLKNEDVIIPRPL